MSHDKYFREELTFLKEQGQEFADLHPQLARFLNGRAMDPDVERLLEGFAFLTSRLRMKVEDEFPELTHSLINMLWPNYLRPVPSMSVVAFTPDLGIMTKQVIKKGVQLDTRPLTDGHCCHYRICRDVEIYPIVCKKVTARHSREKTVVELDFKLINQVTLDNCGLNRLRFYLGGDSYSSQMLYLWLNHYIDTFIISIDGGSYSIPKDAFSVVGFDSTESLLPYPKNMYDGYRILQEYLTFPDAFYFFELSDLDKFLPLSASGNFSLQIGFAKTLPSDVRVGPDNFQLYCTPVINLFEHDAEPIDLEGNQSEYRLLPSAAYPENYEVFSVDQVVGWKEINRVKHKRIYSAFESFHHEVERMRGRKALYFRVRLRENRGSFNPFVSFVREDETNAVLEDEVVSIKVTCTNHTLTQNLEVGDICEPTDSAPSYASFRNITIPTQSLHPVMDGGLLWTLLSNLSLNYLSLLSKEALSTILRTYDFRALVDRQAEKMAERRMESIVKIETLPIDKLLNGVPIRGIKSILYLDQAGFASEGDLYLFGTVLSRFFRLYASINSFHELDVINVTNNECYSWGIQTGTQPLI